MARQLEVRIADVMAGLVTQRPNGNFRFEYDAGYAEGRNRIPLSQSLPLTQRVHGMRPISNWMWGLLPDNETTLDHWARRYQVSARNPFALLANIGEDCPGAVQLAPPGFDFEGRGGVQWISEASLEDRIAALLQDPGAGRLGSDTGQFSLAGAQAKTALYKSAKRWGVPRGRTPTTHILKPEGPRFSGLAANEHFCLQLARAAGVPAVQSEVLMVKKTPVIAVERYDRYRDAKDGLIKRIHQEDCCQALGIPPQRKYQSEGGPGITDIMSLLRFSKSPDVDRDRFMRAQAFNFVIGGTDAHAKNYAILYEPSGAFRLMPLYDLISFLPYHSKRSQLALAMNVSGRRVIDEIQPRHWTQTAARSDFPEERALSHVREMVAELPDLAATVRSACIAAGLKHPLMKQLVDQIADNAKRIAGRF